jgi:hypothetical protein
MKMLNSFGSCHGGGKRLLAEIWFVGGGNSKQIPIISFKQKKPPDGGFFDTWIVSTYNPQLRPVPL